MPVGSLINRLCDSFRLVIQLVPGKMAVPENIIVANDFTVFVNDLAAFSCYLKSIRNKK